VIHACNWVAGAAGNGAQPGCTARARRRGASPPAMTRLATSPTTTSDRSARRSRAASPGRGGPTRSRPSSARVRATCAAHSASAPGRAGRSRSTESGRWRSPESCSSRRSASMPPGHATPRRPPTSSRAISRTVATSSSTCSTGGSAAGRPSRAAHRNAPVTPSAGHSAGHTRSNSSTARAIARRRRRPCSDRTGFSPLGAGSAIMFPRSRLPAYAPRSGQEIRHPLPGPEIGMRLPLTNHRPAIAIHHGDRRQRPGVVGGAHHRAIGPRVQQRHARSR